MHPMMEDAEPSDEHMGAEAPDDATPEDNPTPEDADEDIEPLADIVADLSEDQCQQLMDLLQKRMASKDEDKKMNMADVMADLMNEG